MLQLCALYDSASVVQWIEWQIPVLVIWVRFPSGVLIALTINAIFVSEYRTRYFLKEKVFSEISHSPANFKIFQLTYDNDDDA